MLDWSKLKEFADDNFEFDENCGKFSERVENTVGKGEIARYEQFLLFPQCFQKTCTADTLKPGLVWERVNAGFSSISVIPLRPVHISMLSWSSLNQYSAQYYFQATSCFPT